MARLEDILEQYEEVIRRIGKQLDGDKNVSPADRERLRLLDRLLIGLIRSYSGHYATDGPALDASTSVMYAAGSDTGGVLNVPLRGLVEAATLNAWQARYLNGSLGMRRTLIVTGPEDAGKSTLLNSMVQLISVDQRLVAVEDRQEMPVLDDRSFTVRLGAGDDAEARVKTIRKGGDMQPTWLLVDQLRQSDTRAFFEEIDGSIAGLATVRAPDPELALQEWTATDGKVASLLGKIQPLVVSMDRDRAGKPKIVDLFEVSFEGDGLRLEPKRPPKADEARPDETAAGTTP